MFRGRAYSPHPLSHAPQAQVPRVTRDSDSTAPGFPLPPGPLGPTGHQSCVDLGRTGLRGWTSQSAIRAYGSQGGRRLYFLTAVTPSSLGTRVFQGRVYVGCRAELGWGLMPLSRGRNRRGSISPQPCESLSLCSYSLRSVVGWALEVTTAG